MDESEKLADAYLRYRGFTEIQFEPDGNVPPDFLCDQRVAVEVRRLNQNHDDGSGLKGLEETAIPLSKSIRKLILSLGPPSHGHSWFVFYRFSRPIPPRAMLHVWIKRELKSFMSASDPQPFEKGFRDSFELGVFPASRVWPTFFVPAGYTDSEAGGFLSGELERNLKLCITEKTQKTSKYRANYPEWWLALTDHVAYGLDDLDQEQFRAEVSLIHRFDKIVLLDPRDHRRAFEI